MWQQSGGYRQPEPGVDGETANSSRKRKAGEAHEDVAAATYAAHTVFASVDPSLSCASESQWDGKNSEMTPQVLALYNEVVTLCLNGKCNNMIILDGLNAIRLMADCTGHYCGQYRRPEALQSNQALFNKCWHQILSFWKSLIEHAKTCDTSGQVGTPRAIALHLVSPAVDALSDALERATGAIFDEVTDCKIQLLNQLHSTIRIVDRVAADIEALDVESEWVLNSNILRQELDRHCTSAQNKLDLVDVNVAPEACELLDLFGFYDGVGTDGRDAETATCNVKRSKTIAASNSHQLAIRTPALPEQHSYETLQFGSQEDVVARNKSIKSSIARAITPLLDKNVLLLAASEGHLQAAFLAFGQLGMPEYAEPHLFNEACFVGHLLILKLKAAYARSPETVSVCLRLCHALGALSYLLRHASKNAEAVVAAQEAIHILHPVFKLDDDRHVLLLARLQLQHELALTDYSPNWDGRDDWHSVPLFRHALALRPSAGAKHGLASALQFRSDSLRDEELATNQDELHRILDQLVVQVPGIYEQQLARLLLQYGRQDRKRGLVYIDTLKRARSLLESRVVLSPTPHVAVRELIDISKCLIEQDIKAGRGADALSTYGREVRLHERMAARIRCHTQRYLHILYNSGVLALALQRGGEAWTACGQIKAQLKQLRLTADELLRVEIIQGMAEFSLGEPDAARRTLASALKMLDGLPHLAGQTEVLQLRYALCAVALALGKRAEAREEGLAAVAMIEACRRSADIGRRPRSVDIARAHLFYAAALLMDKEFDVARTQLECALDFAERARVQDASSPEEKTAYDLLARLLEQTGKRRDAEAMRLKAAGISFVGYAQQLRGPPHLRS
ncbi:hypothetical protein OC834_003754 [Tilletia horrida]|nr:hypothetical protein OC834_003754 [Tilletia horrida]